MVYCITMYIVCYIGIDISICMRWGGISSPRLPTAWLSNLLTPEVSLPCILWYSNSCCIYNFADVISSNEVYTHVYSIYELKHGIHTHILWTVYKTWNITYPGIYVCGCTHIYLPYNTTSMILHDERDPQTSSLEWEGFMELWGPVTYMCARELVNVS